MAHVSSSDTLRCPLTLISSGSSLSSLSLSINGNSTPYIRSSKSGSVSGFLVLSHSFQNVQSCTRNHSLPQITVSLVRQTAHNMHVACIASCIHVTKNSNNALPLLAYAVPRTCNHNIQWVRDIIICTVNGHRAS